MAENKVGEEVTGHLLGTLVANRFLINERLGEGSSWQVYLAQDVTNGQRVVVKVLRDEVAGEPEASTRFLKQAEDGFKLNHPNIVHSFATGSEHGRHFLITEYVHGRNLRQWFMDEGRDFSKLREKLKTLCDALQYAHSNGIFHRSLKPENVLVDDNDTVKIADFGFARRLEGQTRMVPTEVTNVAYLAPEQAKGQRGDARSDLYSLGVLMYELSTGKVPFWSPDPVRIVFMHINEAPVRPRHINPKVPIWVEHVVMRLLQKDPGQRYQSVREVKDEIVRLERHNEGEFIELHATDSAQARRVVNFAALVGREQEELRLRECLAVTAAGHGCTILLHGPAGVGKTRLLSDTGNYANLMGFATLRGFASNRLHSPFSPFMVVIREFLRYNDLRVKDVVNDESGILDFFLEGRIDQVLAPDVATFLERYEDIIVQFIRTVAYSQPVMLILEGVEYLDEASTRLVHRLAHEAPAIRLMLALVWRDGGADAADGVADGASMSAFTQVFREIPQTQVLQLGPLQWEGLGALVLALVGAERADDNLLAAIETASSGVPLHVEELLGLLMRDRVLEVVQGQLRFAAQAPPSPAVMSGDRAAAIPLAAPNDGPVGEEHLAPDDATDVTPPVATESDDEARGIQRILATRGLQELIERRMAMLPEKVSMLLTVAACIGETFDFEVLMKVSGKPQDEVISILQWALRHRLIDENWSPARESFRFRHDIVRNALYGALDPRSRKRLHLLIGGATEEALGARIRDVYESLAYHFEESEQLEKAVEYCNLAADRFYSFGEMALAINYYLRALKLSNGVESIGIERRLQWLKRLAHLCRIAGDERNAREFAERALTLARERQDSAEEREIQQLLG